MAFQEIERGEWGTKEPLFNTVSFNRNKNSGSMIVLISHDIDKRLGSPAFVSVLVGSGEHSGFIAFIPRNTQSPSSYKIVRGTGQAVRFGISPNRVGIDKTIAGKRSLPFEITSDGLIVDVRQLRAPAVSLAA